MALFSKKQSDVPERRRIKPGSVRVLASDLNEQQTFRRNRTLTGSRSSHVQTTNETNADMKSPRVQAHILVHKRRRIGLILTTVLIAIMILTSLLWQFTARVQVQAVPDVSLQLDPIYERTIQHYLSSQPIERLRFATDTTHLTSALQAEAPEVESVQSINAVSVGRSLFKLTMRRPIAGWNINGKQRFVDSSGVSFERNYFTSPNVQIVDQSGIQVVSGQAVASNRFLGFVGRTVNQSKMFNLSVEQVIIPSGTTREVDIRLAGISYPVKFLIDRPVGEQVEDAARAIEWFKGRGITPSYIDVRVSGKAYYR
jgi:hypothetical protein